MIKKILTSLSLMAFAASAQAALVNSDPNNLVTNGSFVGAVANSALPTGWSTTAASNNTNTPDTMNATNNFGFSGLTDFAATPSATPDGETWVGLGRDANNTNSQGNPTPLDERMYQTVSGFTVGSQYLISWYEGNFGYDVTNPEVDFLNANAIQVDIGGVYQFNGSFIGTSSDWVTRSFLFEATQTSYDVTFDLLNPARSYLSIDGVSITQVAAVPEPSSYAMLLVGGLMIAGFHRKKQA